MKERAQVLERLATDRNETQFQATVFKLASMYAPYFGVDFDRDVLPNIDNPDWWQADYGLDMVNGVAIGMSIKDAFRCLIDTHRTYVLAQGIHETVSALKQQKESLTAIDAGTGTGILSILLALYGVDNVYALEYNHQTFEATRAFIEQLGLQDKIHLIEADATKVDLGALRADMLVSENLSAGLLDEPQFPIIAHLSQFLAPDAPIIPASATLSVSLGHADWSTIEYGRTEIATRRLEGVQEFSSRVPITTVTSRRGMGIPTIAGRVTMPMQQTGAEVNTVFLHTQFGVDPSGKHVLEPGSARFLGGDWAFRLRETIEGEEADVTMRWPAGVRKNLLEASVHDGEVIVNYQSPQS